MNKKKIKNRDYNQQIIWKGNLKDDCTAEWSGLILRAEWMDEGYWWWCVYDCLKKDEQIDSSNEYEERFIGGEKARNKAEQVAKEYLKNELISEFKESSEKMNIDKLIPDLKVIGFSPTQSILILIKDFGFDYSDAKNKIFDSPVWKGLREQSENMTQAFLNAGVEEADTVEYNEIGNVTSITFDLKKENLLKKDSSWNRLKIKIKTLYSSFKKKMNLVELAKKEDELYSICIS